MIVPNMKNSKTSSSSPSSPLSLSPTKDKFALSFSDLLKGVSDKKDAKVVQNGSLILSLGNEEKSIKEAKTTILKKDSLQSLLKNDENQTPIKAAEPLELNPKLAASLTKIEIKALVSEAKNYLKAKIQDSDGYKKAEVKELPNTLKGLVEVAKKFDIDVSKISFEEIKTHAQKDDKLKDLKIEIPKEVLTHVKDSKTDIAKEDVAQIKDAKTDIDKGTVAHMKDDKRDIPKDAKTDTPKEVVNERKTQAAQMDEKQKNMAMSEAPTSRMGQGEIKIDEKFAEVQKEIKSTPLFKAQSVVEHTTTEQIVQAKANSHSFKTEQKTPKERADETLKLLLRGEKPPQSNSALTADFSVAAARVIASTEAFESTKTLESLLRGESTSAEDGASLFKTESLELLGPHKADSFEVKLNEAKQMIKYLSADVKSAIEDYRSPFTRVKVQLNPQNLGEIDLTVVQRGKNLHVNVSSNNAALNTLSMNINELKVQLSNNGINNATFNFSSGQQNSDTNAGGGHQQRQNEQRAHEEYGYFEAQEANEEILSSLEIIVPRYI